VKALEKERLVLRGELAEATGKENKKKSMTGMIKY